MSSRSYRLGILALICLLGSNGFSKGAKPAVPSWTGYLIDLTCARERKEQETDLGEKHTKKCMQMPDCDRSGFGLLTDKSELLVFDEEGNRKVRVLLQQTKQENHLRAVVRGTKSNDVLKVSRIELQK
jgi:hypothetical protein